MGKYPQVLTSLLYMPQNSIYLDVIQLQKNNRNEALEVDSGLVTVVLGLGGVQKIRIFGDTPLLKNNK